MAGKRTSKRDKTFNINDEGWICSIIQTNGGGYTVAGYTESKGNEESDFWDAKLNSNGNLD